MDPVNTPAKFEVRSFNRSWDNSDWRSLCVSEILPLLCSSTPLFPTPPLVSPKFSHVPMGVGGWPLGYEERRFSANIPRSYFQDFKPCGPDPPTSQTDRQTDRRHTIAIPRFALQCIAR